MIKPIVWWFLVLSSIFALIHTLAVSVTLYRYWWWFDTVMHTWGGVLIVLGLFALGTMSAWNRKPRALEVVVMMLAVTSIWEVFELYVGLWDPTTFLLDTTKDIVVASLGGAVTYLVLR